MKILHTSDWHLGRSLYNRKRYNEFEQFLNWMIEFIKKEKIEIVLIAGDIFDTTTPGNRAQELYYNFLTKASQSGCRHIVIIGGNHDSPTFLNAPKELLRFFNIHVVGEITERVEDEVIVLKNELSESEAIICAVPYLRDKDIRTVEAGETMEDKNQKLIAGIIAHYEKVGRIAQNKRNGNEHIPIVGIGHLFTSGGKISEGDGVRELYVGGVAHVDENSFPEIFDYLALGHLHSVQRVGNSATKWYSGSPIPMGFGEADQEKKVIVIEYQHKSLSVTEHNIPCFQQLERISGDLDEIITKINRLKTSSSNAWLEIEYTGPEFSSGLSDNLNEAILDTEMEILRIKTKRLTEHVLSRVYEQETLDDLKEEDVFNRCLDLKQVKEPERAELIDAYNEILRLYREKDILAE